MSKYTVFVMEASFLPKSPANIPPIICSSVVEVVVVVPTWLMFLFMNGVRNGDDAGGTKADVNDDREERDITVTIAEDTIVSSRYEKVSKSCQSEGVNDQREG